ncbi:hypothetical protein [Microbacterium binotii]|uniref:Uncharacterized protein n=1 Tax=Microbacterium binotii TaxID=462710 RepID=A0ABN3PHX7_9MICO
MSASAVRLIRAQQLSDVAEYAYAATAPVSTRVLLGNDDQLVEIEAVAAVTD